MRPRARRLRLIALASATLLLLAAPASASPGPGPVEGPARPDEDPVEDPAHPVEGPARPAPATAEPPPPHEPPPPSLTPAPEGEGEGEKLGAGIEFAVPPPDEDEDEDGQGPVEDRQALTATFPDPGTAPSDGRDMIVLGGVTTALVVLGLGAGIWVGVQNQVDLRWLLPSTIIPGVGTLAFAGGGLYLGISRARKHHRWEIGYRVIGLPQGRGLMVGGSFTLLAALGFIPGGIALLRAGDPVTGATLIALGGAAAIATPIMFTVGARRQRRYERTGGWKRKPIPPLPPPPPSARLQLLPRLELVPGGVGVGVVGRF